MQIERIKNDKIRFTISSKMDEFGLQRLIDYLKYLEISSKSIAKQSDADNLAEQLNSDWWEKNKSRFNK